MSDIEHGDFNWADDIQEHHGDPQDNSDGQTEILNYNEIIQGYEDELGYFYYLADYLTATNQADFYILMPPLKFVRTIGHLYCQEYENGQHEYVLTGKYINSMDSTPYPYYTFSNAAHLVNAARMMEGLTRLMPDENPMDHIVIWNCGKTWAQMLRELQNLESR